MRKSLLCSTFLLVVGAAAPVAAQNTGASRATCDAKYFDHLVGRSVEEATAIQGSKYRVLAAGAARGVAQPKRMTITFDAATRRITGVDCG